jgi:hypothetical protein
MKKVIKTKQQSFKKTEFDIFYTKFLTSCLKKYNTQIQVHDYVSLPELRRFANLLFKLNKNEAKRFVFDFSKYFNLKYNCFGIKFEGGIKNVEKI